MGIISSSKTINTTAIECNGTLQIQLALTAAPDIQTNPTDIVLALDRSGSMEGAALASLKTAVNQFIDIIADATDGAPDTIGSGSRIAIVSFAGTATNDTGLITSVATLKAAVNALVADGDTNHSAAFITSSFVLTTPPVTNQKVIVMFTDGVTTEGADPLIAATAAKAAGNTIYAIGLEGTGGVDETALESWVTTPASTHLAIAPTPAELAELFANLANNIINAGATDIEIIDIVNPDFIVTSVDTPTVGTAIQQGTNQVVWTIDELGTTDTESATLTFSVQHVAVSSGTKAVNTSITYSDAEGNVAFTAPSPTVLVDCNGVVIAEPCPTPIAIPVDGCEDIIEFDLGDLPLESVGRILQLDVNLQNVCPNRRVALAVILTELDAEDNEFPRGLKTFTIPAHTDEGCRDVLVRCIRFILPEDLNVSGATDTLCGTRNIQAQVFAHYIDNDFQCCTAVVS